ALVISLLTLASFAAPAAAKCPTCVDGVSVQTPDGQPWSEGKPVTLVVTARRGDPGAAFPTTGLAVIMQTDRERTKCLDVPLKLVSQSGDGALYAGVFYPFRAAVYSGLVQFGEFSFDVTIDVNTIAATTPLATSDLPVAAPEQAVGETLSYTIGAVPFMLIAIGFWSAIVLLIARRQPRTRTV
ncbi:MAG TPA: hypothetical protein VI056_03340, partial [Candidatus Limnocylindria bacterium]